MLRRKLVLALGSLVVLLAVVASVAIWSLQQVLSDMDHVNNQATAAVQEVNELDISISTIELSLYELRTRRERHLDRLIDEMESLRATITGLGRYDVVSDPEGRRAYARIKGLLPRFEEQVEALATTLDADLALFHNEKAIDASVQLRQEILGLSRIAQDHARAEQIGLALRFRWLVLGLTVAFLLVINISILVLLRMAGMILRPVERLVEASRQLAKERFDTRVQLHQKDEFDELARAYNHLAEQLQTNEQRKVEMVGQIALTLNHEMNNAMTIIGLQLWLLSRDARGNPVLEKYLLKIRESLERMARTVESLKHVRRIVLTDYTPGVKMFDLSGSAQEQASPAQVQASPAQDANGSDSAQGTSPPALDAAPRRQAGRTGEAPVPAASKPRPEFKSRGGRHALGGATRPLLDQLYWFVRLRWLAGSALMVGSLIDWQWLGSYVRDRGTLALALALGAGILGYNALLRLAIWGGRRGGGAAGGAARAAGRRGTLSRRQLLMLSSAQILLDLGCLTVITVLTGGLRSPVLGFFVFHMVIASLLLPRVMAYAGASVAMLMVAGGLRLTEQWPDNQDARLIMLGWAVTLLLTVYLASRITRRLRRQRRRLVRQNRHIREITDRLARQQQSMIQHEKMVALGQMAAGVAHEIANPLASMHSLLELVRRHPERLQQSTVGDLRDQVQRINQIVQQMKTFAHPGLTEAGSRAAGQAPQLLPLADVVEQALQIVRYDSRMARVRIERDVGGGSRAGDSAAAGAVWTGVRVPGRPLQQVLVNLVLNALDATADVEEPVVTFRAGYSDGWCTIAVKDNGVGILPEHRAQLFEPFFTTKPVGKGTGLGLAVSYGLIRQMGGSIDVQAERGQGATFIIRLPVGPML